MSHSTLSYLAGMLLLFVGQRILDGIDPWQLAISGVGLAALLWATVQRVLTMRKVRDPGLRLGHAIALGLWGMAIVSLVIYVGTSDRVVESLALDEQAEERWMGVTRSVWPMVWLLASIPLLVVDYGLRSSPVMIPARRVRETMVHGVVAAMGLCIVFPLNYAATKRNERWDLAYFKTPTPGTATRALVEALEQPVTVRIFMPPSSEVAQELRHYFAEIEGPKLQVELVDQAANPTLSKALSVRNNGTVAMTQGDIAPLLAAVPSPNKDLGEDPGEDSAADDGPQPVTRRLSVNPDLDKAKRTLKKLDAEVGKMLIELGQGERVAYFTAGHGELNWSSDKEQPHVSVRGLRSRMRELGFTVKQLGMTEGLGERVPDDATLVLVLGPVKPFFQPEIDALAEFRDRGGALLIAREPRLSQEDGVVLGDDPLDGLMAQLGLTMGEGVLAAERNIVPLARNRSDAFNIATNGFSSHATTRVVSERSEQLFVITPGAGHLVEAPGHDHGLVFVMRSLAYVWADLDLDATFSADAGESKEARNLMAVVEGGGDATPWRAVVTADATMFSDLGVGLSLGNQRLVDDTINWLIGAEALSGTTQSEEDIKIEHTKEGQQWWFYLSVLVVPMGVLGLGSLRIRLRRTGGAA